MTGKLNLLVGGLAATFALFGVATATMAQSSELAGGALQGFENRFALAWPDTDFTRTAVAPDEFLSGGPTKDGIPSIDNPQFVRLKAGRAQGWATRLDDREAVISIDIAGDARAYPLRVLIWHEIVNDEVGSVPVSVTYCPLCNASVVFDRRLDGRILDFGTTGLLRHADLVMYDRQTESWWQQFTGDALVGRLTGSKLRKVPSRLESLASFRQRYPDGLVLVPNDPRARQYGINPYENYDTGGAPGFLTGEVDTGPLAPMDHVIVFEAGGKPNGVALNYLRKASRLEVNGVMLEWQAGQASALDTRNIAEGRDIGNVTVRRRVQSQWMDVPHQVTFAFAFRSFFPSGVIISNQFDHHRSD